MTLFLCLLTLAGFSQTEDDLERARALYKSDNYTAAIQVLDDYIQKNKESFEAQLLLGNCFQKEEKFVAAVRAYEKAEKLNKQSALLKSNHGAAYLNLNQFDEARTKLKSALKLDPELPEAHYFMGNLEYYEYRTSGALKHYNKALELRPDYRDALYMRAAAFAEMEKYELALKDYEHVLELDPTLDVAKYNAAVIYILNEQYDKGIELLQNVRPIELPSPQDFYFYMGEALYFSGEKDKSCELYAKAGEMGDSESQKIYLAHCVAKKEREKKPEKKIIRMAF